MKQYTVKFTNIKTNKDYYIDLKPMSLIQVKIFKSKFLHYANRQIVIIPYTEYEKNKEK